MKKIKAILFDHDGTLVDSEYTHYLHWKRVMEKYSVNFPLNDYIKGFTGVPTYQNALDLIEKYDLRVLPEILVREMEIIEVNEMKNSRYPLMPFALETIKFFKEKGLLLAIVSGANHKEVETSVSKHDIMHYFEFILGGDDVIRSKPAPDVYLKALKLLNFSQDECAALEDTESGIKAATSAGLTCVGVKNKYSETQDFSKATHLVSNLNEAKNWISSNFKLA